VAHPENRSDSEVSRRRGDMEWPAGYDALQENEVPDGPARKALRGNLAISEYRKCSCA